MEIFIEYLKVILLGIIEGITEWLPVSSTGHMYLFDEFIPFALGADAARAEAFKSVFMVVIQVGAILAVILLFWKKLWPFALTETQKPTAAQNATGVSSPAKTGKRITAKKDVLSLWLKIIVACLPAVVFGFFLDDLLDTYLYNGVTIAITLIVYGVAFIVVEYYNAKKNRLPLINDTAAIDYKTALVIGAFQVLALIPGTSRSGATIVGALIIGVSRPVAAEFTFFLAVPIMLGASFLKIVKFFLNWGFFTGVELGAVALGMVVAFVVSFFAVKFLMEFVKKHDFKVFGWYRIALGAVVLLVFILQIAGVLPSAA